jgi:hypothetical protein
VGFAGIGMDGLEMEGYVIKIGVEGVKFSEFVRTFTNS